MKTFEQERLNYLKNKMGFFPHERETELMLELSDWTRRETLKEVQPLIEAFENAKHYLVDFDLMIVTGKQSHFIF